MSGIASKRVEQRRRTKRATSIAKTAANAQLTAHSSNLIDLGTGLLLLALGIWAFWPALSANFLHFDDLDSGTLNWRVHSGLCVRNIGWAFANLDAGYYVPLQWLSLMADAQLWGMRPIGFHLTNLLIHLTNGLLLYLFLDRATGRRFRSIAVAGLFLLHPLRVESVAWVSERKDVVAAAFGLLTLLTYLWYSKRPSVGRYLLCLGMFALSLLGKPMLVALPLVLLAVDVWPLRRVEFSTATWPEWRTLVLEKVPFLAIALADAIVTLVGEQQVGAVAGGISFSFASRVGNALVAYVRYLWKMVWFGGLAISYPHPDHWPAIEVAGALALLVAISVVAFRLRRSSPWLLAGWFWFVVLLLPMSGLIQVGAFSMADRFTYFPTIGLLTALVWSLPRRWMQAPTNVASAAGLLALCAALAWFTRVQCGYWKDDYTLFGHCLAVTSENWIAENFYGSALLERGDIDGAIEYCSRALQREPSYVSARVNLGLALLKAGDPSSAAVQFQQAAESDPASEAAQNDWGNALAAQGHVTQAIEHYKRSLKLNPDYAEARNNFGVALAREGRLQEALAQFEQVIDRQPDFPEAYRNASIALSKLNRGDEAVAVLQRGLQIVPDHVETRITLANVLAQQGNFQAAIAEYREVLKNYPEDAVTAAHLRDAEGALESKPHK